MKTKKGEVHIDWAILLTVLILVVIGFLTLYSNGYDQDTNSTTKEFYMQILWFFLGVIAFFLTISINYNEYVERGVYLYLFGLLLLVLTLVIGTYSRNIKAWIGVGIFKFQPSEMMKIFTIIVLAKFINMLGDDIRDIRNFFITFLIVLPPMALISMQPDFGTALVFVPIIFAMLFIAGAQLKHIMSLIALVGIAIGIPMVVAYYKQTENMSGWLIQIIANNGLLYTISFVTAIIAFISFIMNFFTSSKIFIRLAMGLMILPLGLSTAAVMNSYLKPYQRKRIVIFIDPEMDYYGAGYNIIQSKIAIGSGGFSGQGYLKGSQNQLSFLPEKKTDFVFSSIGEEWGFMGTFFLLGIFALFIYRSVMISYHSKDFVGSLIAVGIVAMFVFHIFINIGMASGMMPVTGLPLPFISYGGSNLLTNIIAVGLLFNIEMRRYVHGT